MKKIITNQQKSRMLLMVVICYMKVQYMIDDYESKGEWKIQITIRIIFISFIDKNETQLMHTKSDNVEITSGTDTSDSH